MKKSIENVLDKNLSKGDAKVLKENLEKEIQDQVQKETKILEKEFKKELDGQVKEEVKKRVNLIVKETRRSTNLFKKEFLKQTSVAITAAFAFLIALSWRTPIQSTVDILIEDLGLTGTAVYVEYISAVVITLIAVVFLLILSKFTKEK